MSSLAQVEGVVSIRTPGPQFTRSFAQRVRDGLLPGGPLSRNRYVVTHEGPERLAFRAEGWATAFNVGLNDVELRTSPGGTLKYSIQFARWERYALALCGAIGILMILSFLVLDLREYVRRHPASGFPNLSPDQNAMVGWAIALFFGFVWPWLLVALHRRPVRRLLERIIADVDATAGAPVAPGSPQAPRRSP